MDKIYYKTETLDAKARKILTEYSRNYFNEEPKAIPIERIIEEMFGLTIDYVNLTVHKNELGRMVYDGGYTSHFNTETDNYALIWVTGGTMLIEATLLDNPKTYGRYRFTLAHELAHWILHKDLFTGTRVAAASYTTDKDVNNSTEWQANYLAKAILMPLGQLKRAFYSINDEKSTKIQKLTKLCNIFEVSRQAMEIRLKELELLLT